MYFNNFSTWFSNSSRV